MDHISGVRLFGGGAATLTPPDRLLVRSFGIGQPASYDQASNGNRLYRRDPVFKVGTFKDSWGDQTTWEATHLTQMVFNFDMLRNAGKLTSVPWRDGHPSIFGGGGDVIGWVQSLEFEDGVLYADWLCTEPEAGERYDRGTYGPRSAEVGYYESNDEAMYWPVFMGCAFVDIPAVEGLFTKERSMDQLNAFSVLPDTEINRRVVLFNGQQSAGSGGGNGNGGEGGGSGGSGGGSGGQGGSGGGQGGATPAPGQPDPHPTTGNPASEPPAQPQQHVAPAQPFTFRVNGQPTTDFSAVQQHITVLETAQREQTEQARRDFVADLARPPRNVISASQVQDFERHVLSLTSEQFEAFRNLYGSAAPMPLFQQHGTESVNPNGGGSAESTQVDTDKAIVKQHQRAGQRPEKIKETPSYKRLVAAGQAPSL